MGLRNYSFRQKIINCGIYNVQWTEKSCWNTFFHPHSANISLWKDNFSWQHFQKISQTLRTETQKVMINVAQNILEMLPQWGYPVWKKILTSVKTNTFKKEIFTVQPYCLIFTFHAHELLRVPSFKDTEI